jgi:hypothetical protein
VRFGIARFGQAFTQKQLASISGRSFSEFSREKSRADIGKQTLLTVFPNHVCFNISYKFRPLTADWMAKTLRA